MYHSTLCNHILDALLLLPLPFGSLILLTQLRQYERFNAFEDARKNRIARIEEPSLRVCGVFEEDAALEDGIFAYSKITTDGCHYYCFAGDVQAMMLRGFARIGGDKII